MGHEAPRHGSSRPRPLYHTGEELLDFVETAPVALRWVGADGRIQWANQAELDLLGYDHDEYVGLPIADFHADAEVARDVRERLRRAETLRDYPARLRHKDGSLRHVLIDAHALCRDGAFV